jgi:hypothetical protein
MFWGALLDEFTATCPLARLPTHARPAATFNPVGHVTADALEKFRLCVHFGSSHKSIDSARLL